MVLDRHPYSGPLPAPLLLSCPEAQIYVAASLRSSTGYQMRCLILISKDARKLREDSTGMPKLAALLKREKASGGNFEIQIHVLA